MLNGDLLKLFRMGAMTRISHFVCQGKYLYPAHDLKYAEVFIFLPFVLLFQDLFFFFPPHVTSGNMNHCLCSLQKISLFLPFYIFSS